MGLFRRRAASTVHDDAPGAEVEEASRGDGETAGPYDIAQVPELGARIDLGALRVPALKGMQLRVALDPKGRVPVAATLGLDGSTVQLQVLAAPKSASLWDELRPTLAESFVARGGSCEERDAAFGPELRARVPVTAKGGSGYSSLRVVGVDGTRWLLRAVISGPAAVQEEAMAWADGVIRRVVVNRGKEARPPREVLPLTVPGMQTTRPAPETDPLSLLQRGPELTETR